jgi:hypothetical protein
MFGAKGSKKNGNEKWATAKWMKQLLMANKSSTTDAYLLQCC